MKFRINKSLEKKLLGIMFLSLILGIAAQFMAEEESPVQENRLIQKEPGEGSVTASLSYQRDGGNPEEYEVQVPERVLTREEWEILSREAETELLTKFLGENESVDHVSGKVTLCEKLQNGLFSVEWNFTPDQCIDPEGKLLEENFSDGDIIEAQAVIRYRDYELCYSFPFLAYHEPLTEEQVFQEELSDYMEQQDLTTGSIALPTEVAGQQLSWKLQKEHTIWIFLLLGVVAAAAVLYGEYAGIQKQRERESREMLRDYPEIVSELSLFLSAGMSVNQAFGRILEGYEKKSQQRHGSRRAGYEQIGRMVREIQDGVPQLRAIECMGERSGLSQYRRLATVLCRNMKKGSVGIAALLEKEAAQAFAQRKSMAQRAGDEAGTKLLFPMMLMLVVVMVILIVPAFMSMNL